MTEQNLPPAAPSGSWWDGKKTIIAAVLAMAASEGWIHIDPDVASKYLDLIPIAGSALMIFMRLVTPTPLGQRLETQAAAAIQQIDPGFDLKAYLDANMPQTATIVSLAQSLQTLHAKVDAIQKIPASVSIPSVLSTLPAGMLEGLAQTMKPAAMMSDAQKPPGYISYITGATVPIAPIAPIAPSKEST